MDSFTFHHVKGYVRFNDLQLEQREVDVKGPNQEPDPAFHSEQTLAEA